MIIENNNFFLCISKIVLLLILIHFKFKLQKNYFFFDDKISVVIPTYNRGYSIIECLNSVLEQTYKNIEILVIDDCSTDNTESLISKIEDDRVKYIKLNEKKGASFARNIGIKYATGKYISFQDSDDIYHKDKIEKQYKNLIKKNSEIDFCRVCLHFNSSFKATFPREYQEKKIRRRKILEELCNGNFISTQSLLISNFLIKNTLFDLRFSRLQDYDLILRLLPNKKISYTKEVLIELYRKNDSIGSDTKKLNESLHLLSLKEYKINCKKDSFLYNPLNPKFYLLMK